MNKTSHNKYINKLYDHLFLFEFLNVNLNKIARMKVYVFLRT